MKNGVWIAASDEIGVDRMVELGVLAEESGWGGVFVSDSLPFAEHPDPWVVLAGIAAQTETVRLGTWVVPLPRRQPWQVAQEVATLDRLSGGRVILGAGIGNSDDYDDYGMPYEPRERGERLDEILPTIPSEDPAAFADTAAELGSTWQLVTDLGGDPNTVAERIREGPP